MLVGCAAPNAEQPVARPETSVADLEQHAFEKWREGEVEALLRLLDRFYARRLETERSRRVSIRLGRRRPLPNQREEIIARAARAGRQPPDPSAPPDPGAVF